MFLNWYLYPKNVFFIRKNILSARHDYTFQFVSVNDKNRCHTKNEGLLLSFKTVFVHLNLESRSL